MKTILPLLLAAVLMAALSACGFFKSEVPVVVEPAAAATAEPTPEPVAGDIGYDAALEIALEHAGLSGSQITLHKNMLGFSDGRAAFAIVFYFGNTTYTYSIDASSGAILSSEQS